MPILSSVILTNQLQANGTFLIHEQHTDSNGIAYDVVYYADSNSDVNAVCQLRGQQIGAEIDKRGFELSTATNFEIPLTAVEIMRRLTPQEWDAFQKSTDINIAYFRAIFSKATTIYRNDQLTQLGIAALVATGILTQQRTSEVFA